MVDIYDIFGVFRAQELGSLTQIFLHALYIKQTRTE